MTSVLGLARSWPEAYAHDEALFTELRERMEGGNWVAIPSVPSLDVLATISSTAMTALMNQWKTQAGPAPDWDELWTLRLADPPSYPLFSPSGPQVIHDAVIMLESNPGGEADPAAEGIDILPFSPWTGAEAVRPLEADGRIRTLYSAYWPIWSWTLLDAESRLEMVRALRNSLERGWTGPAVYETALVDLCRHVITHRLPLRFTWAE